MNKEKVLILQGILSSYRVPIFNIIGERYDLTVGYCFKDESLNLTTNFKKLKLKYKKIFSLYFNPGLKQICNQYDVVIIMGDLHHISYISLPFISNKFKSIIWTFGVRASYSRRFNLNEHFGLIQRITGLIFGKADACLLYMKEPINYWIKNMKLSREKFFVAHNTVAVLPTTYDSKEIKKNSILFIGSLYEEKKLDELIDAYIETYSTNMNENTPILEIIGDGPERSKLEDKIRTEKIRTKIFFYGSVFDENEIASFFSKALICVSPDQAGLSVLKSFGYGVPFITRSNAITGGERLNIINNYNGIYYDTYCEIIQILNDVIFNRDKFIKMGENALKYYNTFATPNIMANGFIDAINYVMLKKIINTTSD